MSTTINYCESGPLDEFVNAKEAENLQYGLSKLAEDEFNKNTSDVRIALKILEAWSYSQSYHESCSGVSGSDITVYASKDVIPGLSTCFNEEHWKDVFQHKTSSRQYWDDLFTAENYVNTDIGQVIPENKFHRLVFHFLYRWRNRFRYFILHRNVPENRKIDVLKKQIENITFMSRRRVPGSYWHMVSTPDHLLQQALSGDGAEVQVIDNNGEPVTDIMRNTIKVIASGNVDTEKAGGPKPDNLDRTLYKKLITDAKRELRSDVKATWTMVRSSFVATSNGEPTEIRCYAFSGAGDSTKQIHDFPSEWWKTNKFDFLKDNMDIYFCNVDGSQFCQNMIKSIFDALNQYVTDDLKKLTKHIAFDNLSSAQYLILENRSDLSTIDYGEFYDCAIKIMNRYDDMIKRAVRKVLSKLDNAEELIKKIWTMVSVGEKNQQFAPNTNALNSVQEICNHKDKIENISKNHLSQLQRELEGLPAIFLDELRKKRFGKWHCGEDNVLCLLLCKFLKAVKLFCMAPVKFVALDSNNLNGKPFCEVCNRKVRFYSVLPTYLYELGLNFEDLKTREEELSNLVKKVNGNM